MLRKIIEFSLLRRPMVLAVLFIFIVGGFIAFHQLNIEAYPDPSPPMDPS